MVISQSICQAKSGTSLYPFFWPQLFNPPFPIARTRTRTHNKTPRVVTTQRCLSEIKQSLTATCLSVEVCVQAKCPDSWPDISLPNQPADTHTCSSMGHDEQRLALDFMHTLINTGLEPELVTNVNPLCAFPLKREVLTSCIVKICSQNQ